MDVDSDDEWFLQSIKRYKQLIMFDAGDPIHQIELSDENTICVLSEKKCQKTIIILMLPTKISHNYLGSGEIQLSNDLKIKNVIFPSSTPTWISAVYGENRLITTQNNISGLTLYNMKLSNGDQNPDNIRLDFPLLDPKVALINKSTVVLAKNTQQNAIIGDINNGETLRKFIFDEGYSSSLIPVCINEKVIAFCEKSNGTSHLYDWKTNENIGKINVEEVCDTAIIPCTSYLYTTTKNSSENLFFLSQSGIFKSYDLRHMTKPIMRRDLKFSTVNEHLKIQFKPDNFNIISISGFNNNVYLYDYSNNMEEIFVHDGHSRTEECVKNTLVTDHLWHPNDYVISGALNNSINCWIPDKT